MPLLPAVLLMTGCATDKDRNAPRNVTQDRVSAFLSKAEDPRRHWLNVYQSENGPVFVGSHRLHANQQESLEFESRRKSKAPVIEIRGHGDYSYPALLDTSARENWIALDGALEMGLIPMGPPAYERTPRHVYDPTVGYLCLATKLRMGQFHIENALFYTLTSQIALGPVARNIQRPPPRMVLGCALLRALRYLQLDYPEKKAILSSTLPFEPVSGRLLAEVPMMDWNGIMAVRGRIDGLSTIIILDSAGDFELAMRTPAKERVDQLSAGNMVWRQVQVTDTESLNLGYPDTPRIGRQLLRKYRVTFDNRQQVVFFERPED